MMRKNAYSKASEEVFIALKLTRQHSCSPVVPAHTISYLASASVMFWRPFA